MRKYFVVLALLAVVLLVFPSLVGCTSLQQVTGSTGTSASSAATMIPATASTLAATTTTHHPAATTTTGAPAATTTTTSGGLHVNPGVLHTNPSIMTLDPNYLLTPTRYEDTSPFIHYEMDYYWKTQTNGSCSGGSQRFSTTKGSWASIFFTGTGVQLIASKGANGGRLIVNITGPGVDRLETVDLKGSPQYQQTVWYSGHLTSSTYEVYFQYDNANGTDAVVWLDAIDVWGSAVSP